MDLGGLGGLIGAGAGAFLGGPAGAAAGATVGGGIDTNAANAARADSANQWSAQQYATRYQTTVKDLEAAGLNPMLAYSQGAGSAPTAQQVTFQNPYSSAAQAYQGGVTSEAQAEHHVASADQARHMTDQIDATVSKIKEETKNIPLEADKLKFTIQKLAEEAANIAQDTENKTFVRKQISATISKLKAETDLLNFDVKANKDLNGLGAESRQFKTIIDLIRAVK